MSVTLVSQHAKRMRRIVLPPVACLAVQYVSTLTHKRQDFRCGGGGWGVIEHRACVFFYKLSEIFLILRII
jgi:hypothetical protein